MWLRTKGKGLGKYKMHDLVTSYMFINVNHSIIECKFGV